jgi:DNA-directed RNA polymerase specialized sigma24 family protein
MNDKGVRGRSAASDRRFAQLIEPAAVTLRRALVARNGVEDGCDAAAEAIAWAWEHRADVEAMDNPLGYLFRVGHSSLRRERRIRARRGQWRVEAYVEPSVSFDSDLFAALRRLTPDQRTAVVLVHMYGFSYTDASDVLDVSEAAVTNHVHRGLRRLRQLLGEGESS